MYLFLIVSIAVVFIILLIFMPLLQVRALKENDNTTEIKIQIKDLENKFRLTIAQIFGGIIILFGAYATIKSIDENQKKRLRENFNEAVLNLSSTESNSDLKKVASVYIIESVSKELSDEYYKTSMEIFSYYLNMNVNRKNSTDSTTSLVINSIFDVFGNQKHINYNGKYSFLEFKDLNLK